MTRRLPTSAPGLAMLGLVLMLVFAPAAMRAQRAPADPANEQTTPGESARAAPCPRFPGAGAFVDKIDNLYLPLKPGTSFTYRATDGERIVVEVTNQTKTIIGVRTRVVRDTVRDKRGELVEDTRDWFAQDRSGNVWYFGEEVKNYENGKLVDTEGSWEAGVDRAKPGIIMQAHPRPGQRYAQECAPGVAEDKAEVLRLGESVEVPFSSFDNVLVTKEWTPLEPGVAEQKFYAPCVGLVRELKVRGGRGETELVDVKPKPPGTNSKKCYDGDDRRSSEPPADRGGAPRRTPGQG